MLIDITFDLPYYSRGHCSLQYQNNSRSPGPFDLKARVWAEQEPEGCLLGMELEKRLSGHEMVEMLHGLTFWIRVREMHVWRDDTMFQR
jgi:hypothetical protein